MRLNILTVLIREWFGFIKSTLDQSTTIRITDKQTMDFKPDLLQFKIENFAACIADIKDGDSDEDSESERNFFECSTLRSENRIDCNGIEWCFKFFGNRSDRDWDEVWIGFDFEAIEGGRHDSLSLTTDMFISIKNAMGKTVVVGNGGYVKGENGPIYGVGAFYSCCFESNFIKSSTVLDSDSNILKDGALCVDVLIQSTKIDRDRKRDEKSRLSYEDRIHELLEQRGKADVFVNVDGQIFHLHSSILENNAPILAEFCKKSDNAIDNMNEETFRVILEYIYAGNFPKLFSATGDSYANIIAAANRFGLIKLKDAVEKIFVCERHVFEWNAAKYIVFAHEQYCPLLKEYAISVFLLFAEDILNSDDSKALRESGELMSEIMKKMAVSKRKLEVGCSKKATRQRKV